MHVHSRKITILFEIWIFWVGRARETTNQVEVALISNLGSITALVIVLTYS